MNRLWQWIDRWRVERRLYRVTGSSNWERKPCICGGAFYRIDTDDTRGAASIHFGACPFKDQPLDVPPDLPTE